MKKWTGGVLIVGLALILVISYSFVGKSAQQKQSAYDFFNNHPADNANPEGRKGHDNVKSAETDVKKALNFKGKPRFVHVEGLSSLYSSLGNFSKEESKALQVWSRMRFLLPRSDALPETLQGIKEAAAVWKELLSTVQEDKASKANKVGEDVDCPYYVSAFNGTKSRSQNATLEIPCGLVEDSSVTVIGMPDALQDGFQIELIGSKLSDEPRPPLVLQYKVFLPGKNLTKEPFVIQNAWANESGWGKEERCPDRGSTDFLKVDGLVKCNAQSVRTAMPENSNGSNRSSDKLTNFSDGGTHGSATFPFPYFEGIPFTASLWVGLEGFHMTVNGRHETSFAYREKLEPWLVGGVEVKGGLATIAILAKGLPVSNDLNLDVDLELLKAPSVSKKELVLMIGVFSTANNFERRMALRRSWMQYDAVRSAEVAVRFFIGLHKKQAVNYELWREAQAYGDIQLMPFVDYYSLLSLKTIAICILGTEILTAKYIMKTDDDAFVRIDEVVSSLKGKASSSDGLLYGHISFESSPHRDKENKWYVSPEEWPYASYPPWAHGPGYVISRDIAKFIVGGHRERDIMKFLMGLQLFKLEDVAVGIWIEQFKSLGHSVKYVDDERFYISGCEPNYVLAHYQTPRKLLCMWEKLQKQKHRHDGDPPNSCCD
ncbi:hydroxyproline O-galactosyltransferase GALT3-like isoform X1 [Coffea arabica]|uniref:Hydroxyproline O-galactosyltransferase GALT3-like isoform X1 n=1 Tax=Coffea arabica TaxID=13443 RepID=A0ABM4X107_COFAR